MPTLILFLFLKQVSGFAQSADIIFTNGKIFTSDTTKLYVQALAIKGNKILSVGSNALIEKFASAKTKKIDLKGKTVVPGFNDAHDHLGWLIPTGKSFITPFSVTGLSKNAVIDSLARLVKEVNPEQWIYGTIGLTVFNDTTIRRRLLDSISSRHPIMLLLEWGHGMILNSKALQAIHVSNTAPDPLGGWYERKQGTNYLTGVLYEGSQFPAWQALTVSEPPKLIKSLRAHASEEIAFGITTVQNMSSTLQGNAARRFFAKASLPVRTRIIAVPASTEFGRSLTEWNHSESHITPLTYVSGIKYIIDGTSLEQNALKTNPYPNRSNWYGRLNFPLDTLKQILKEALVTNRQLLMHLAGDSATKVILRLMKQMASDDQWKGKRVRIEHGTGVLTDELIKEVNDMGIIIVHTPQVGMRSPLQKWLSTGIHIAVGPDALINPYLNIMFMTTRQVNPNENLTREQAVIAYTHGSAYAEFAEKEKGTLAKGMLADLAVLSQDIFTISPQQLPSTRSLMTIINGKIMYEQREVISSKSNQ
ncbi:MAG: amidohydrolase family protein [Chitinophagaceae bacterium]